jgi:hypothetical protein
MLRAAFRDFTDVGLHNSRLPTSLYSPAQVGPHIYDIDGQYVSLCVFDVHFKTSSNLTRLVWSGAHLFGDRPTFDFKVARHNGSEFLTFIGKSHFDMACAIPWLGLKARANVGSGEQLMMTCGRRRPHPDPASSLIVRTMW